MSRNFDLWQRASEPEPQPEPVVEVPPVPVRSVSSELGRPIGPTIYEPAAPVQEEELGWLEALGAVKKHWRWGLLCAVVIAAAAAAVVMQMKPVYEPFARLEVDQPGSVVVSLGRSGDGERDSVDTQLQNLQGDSLALQVIRELHLDQNPAFVGKLPPSVEPPAPSGELAPRLTPAEDAALRTFTESRKVTHEMGSRLISVSVGADDPVLAAEITNTLTNAFIQDDLNQRSDKIEQWQRQLDDIKKRMDESNRTLAKYQSASGIGGIGDNQTTFSEHVIELGKQLMQAQADRIQLQAYLDKLDASRSTSLPQISSDLVVQNLTEQLATAKAQLAQTLTVYGANHPNALKLENQIKELQAQLSAQRSAILDNLQTSYTASKAREGLLASQMAGATRQMSALAEYNALKREADTNTQLYTALYEKVKELGIADETKSTSIRVVDPARVLSHPTKPKRLLYIAGGTLAGLLGGLVLIFVLEGLDTRIRTPEDLRRCLGAGSVSVVPVIAAGARYSLAPAGIKWLGGNQEEQEPLFLLDRPNSPEAEALRGIYTAVRLSWRNSGGAARVLMVTSALPGEGKTTLAVNLALALAQQGPTCLVSADLRKKEDGPKGAARVLGISRQRGLSNVLSGNLDLDEAIVAHPRVAGLAVLPAGEQYENPGLLMASNAMSDVLGQLRRKFEFVVVDSAPILPFADARLISVMVDGILMIGRSGVTRRENLKRAAEMLRAVHSAPVLEYVLNASDTPAFNYGGYKYGYGYSSGSAASK